MMNFALKMMNFVLKMLNVSLDRTMAPTHYGSRSSRRGSIDQGRRGDLEPSWADLAPSGWAASPVYHTQEEPQRRGRREERGHGRERQHGSQQHSRRRNTEYGRDHQARNQVWA